MKRCFPLLVLLLAACTKKPDTPKSPEQELADHGRVIYQSSCIACHNSDPRKPGAVGPEVFGSSQELLEARIMSAKYPDGYKPKRDTHQMQPLPQLKNEIPALFQYLNSN